MGFPETFEVQTPETLSLLDLLQVPVKNNVQCSKPVVGRDKNRIFRGTVQELDNAASIEDFPDATTRCEVVELLAFKLDIRGELFTE